MNKAPHAYRGHLAPWVPGWHVLTIWDCIGDLIVEERRMGARKPPRAPAVLIEGWRQTAVKEGNEAIERMLGDIS